MLIPMVIEQTNRGERAYDIYSRLLKDNVTPSVIEISSPARKRETYVLPEASTTTSRRSRSMRVTVRPATRVPTGWVVALDHGS